jgi:hypothetical protein
MGKERRKIKTEKEWKGKQKKDNIEEVEDVGRKKSKKATIRERGHRYRIRE